MVFFHNSQDDLTKLPCHVVTKVEEHVASNDEKEWRGKAFLFAPDADDDIDEDTDVDDNEPEDDDDIEPRDRQAGAAIQGTPTLK